MTQAVCEAALVPVKKERIRAIDALRGLAVILMVLHHFFYDLDAFCSIPIPFLYTGTFFVLQNIFSGLFILLAGLGSGFTKGKYARALKIILLATVITLVSMWFYPDAPILFGILHFLGTSMLVYAVIGRLLEKIPIKIAFFIYLALFIISYGYSYRVVEIPYLFMFGFYPPGFVSADYVPILPWIFMFLMGTTLKRPVLEHKFPEFFYRISFKPFELVGKNSLIIFLLHQPIILGGIYLIRLLGGKL